jgi:very-short-patch-repair endonuclease
MNPEQSDPPRREPSAAVRAQIDAFKIRLNDFTRNNPLLFFRELKVGTLLLPETTSPAIAKLLGGTPLTLADLELAGDTATRAKLRAIRAKARSNEEERGLQTLFVAIGFVTWRPGGTLTTDRAPMAPLALLPVNVIEANRPGVDPKIVRAGDVTINAALLAYVTETYRIAFDATESEPFDDDEPADVERRLATLRGRLSTLPDVTFPNGCAIGNFNFQKMAMVADLTVHLDEIAESDLVAAIANDPDARAAVARAQIPGDMPAHLDDIAARDELFVLDADSSQQRALHGILRSTGHAVIDGPPGTGKSQTIANLIAASIGAGKRVLFVAEKRAALDAVRKRLERVGLGHLVLDLHGADVKRKTIYQGLVAADRAARTAQPPEIAGLYARFEAARATLNARDAAMHETRPGAGCSVYDLLERLSALPAESACDLRFTTAELDALPPDAFAAARALFAEAVALGPFFGRDSNVPWATADLPDDAAAARAVAALEALVGDVHDAAPLLTGFAAAAGLAEPTTLEELDAFARALSRAVDGRRTFDATVYDLDLATIVRELEPQEAGAFARFVAFFDGEHRANLARLRGTSRGTPDGHALFLAARDLDALPAVWKRAATFAAVDATDAPDLRERLARIVANAVAFLAVARPVPAVASLAALRETIAAYRRTQVSAQRVAAANALRARLSALGVASVVRELERAPRAAALWPATFEAIWLRSNVERFTISDPRIAAFDRAAFDEVVHTFRALDVDRLGVAARRIRRAAAEAYIAAQDAHPDEAVIFRANLAKKIRQLPLRALMTQAGRITTALCPCWMASPLSVSQLTDPRSKFDLVIFDEASQVLPEDAITSIARGRRVVVAGDDRQLPPTTFFSAASDDDDDDDDADTPAGDAAPDATKNIESILDVMSVYVRPQTLEWHYRSLDERLIAFSNKEFYGNRLITFPSREEPPPAMRHCLVAERPGDGHEESGSAEVLRVVELVLEHARDRPQESLGVIALGIKHAMRIEKALYERRHDRPELDAFFADRGERSFFCKNLERVQGDERDAIVLSVGYGKNAKGDMLYRFGPLNNAGGERRLNVAISRAIRRMTVVSSFRSIDLDDARLNARGAQSLKRYLRFAESSGRDLGDDAARDDVPMNAFENDIFRALAAKGLALVPQWGTSSYRLDFAVKDPRTPGAFCLAIECDGATYHSAQTARDRDRIRQTHLEDQGWRFHRIWSTDWFANRAAEIDRAVAAYEAALAAMPASLGTEPVPASVAASAEPPADAERAPVRGPRPDVVPGRAIEAYAARELAALVRWIGSDGLLRTEDEIVHEAARELGFARVGARIDRTLRDAIARSERA